MENKEGRHFTKKHGAVLMFSLCLTGAAAFGTFYTLNMAEKEKVQQEQFTEMEEEAKIQEANAAKKITAKEEDTLDKTAENTDKAEETEEAGKDAEVSASNLTEEILEDPESLLDGQSVSEAPSADVSSSNVEASLGHILEEDVVSPTVDFTENSTLDWPVAGNVLLDYSMDASIFFPTLQVYKYNPALIIGAEVGSQVVSAAKGIVESIEVNAETGTTITMNVGNNYELVYGQLKEVPVAAGDVVEEGGLLGYVSEPTKYYCEEGSNLYFKMMKDGAPVDPFLYLGE